MRWPGDLPPSKSSTITRQFLFIVYSCFTHWRLQLYSHYSPLAAADLVIRAKLWFAWRAPLPTFSKMSTKALKWKKSCIQNLFWFLLLDQCSNDVLTPCVLECYFWLYISRLGLVCDEWWLWAIFVHLSQTYHTSCLRPPSSAFGVIYRSRLVSGAPVHSPPFLSQRTIQLAFYLAFFTRFSVNVCTSHKPDARLDNASIIVFVWKTVLSVCWLIEISQNANKYSLVQTLDSKKTAFYIKKSTNAKTPGFLKSCLSRFCKGSNTHSQPPA